MSVRIVHLLLWLAVPAVMLGCKKKPDEAPPKKKSKALVFKLDEVSPFYIGEKVFTRDLLCQCSNKPDAYVKDYPAFKSDKPLYGSVRFAREYGEEPSGIQYHFAIDESAGTAQGYDRFYFDFNRDLDLANEAPLLPLKNPPDGAILTSNSLKQQVSFDYLNVNFDFGSDGQCPLEIMPRLTISDEGHTALSFITTKAREGQIEVAGQQYTVFLGHNFLFGGWLDRALHLTPKGDYSRQPKWSGADRLRAIHKIGETYYRFSATPEGDKLFVRPYDGEFGTFRIGSGWRPIFNKQVRGSLLSKDAALAVGGELKRGRPQSARSCRLPIGDYLPATLTITFGHLRITVSDNYHSDGKPRDMDRPKVYGIKIRKNKPFVLDFSHRPEVIFASPAVDRRVKPGEELIVKAVLIDPKLDIMIRGLDDTSRKQKKQYVTPDGQKRTIEQVMSLDPKVVITRANSEKVAEGGMPFG